MTGQLRTLALAEKLGSIPSTNIVVHSQSSSYTEPDAFS